MFNKYPYTDFHELNADWILMKIRELQQEMSDFIGTQTITFQGAWDITHQYPAWSIVEDNNMGYVSIKPVPAGIIISNTDYWVKIFDYSALFNEFEVYVNKRYIFIGDSYEGTGNWGFKVTEDLGLDTTFRTITSQLRANINNNSYIAAQGGMGFTNKGSGPDPDDNGFLSLLQNALPFIDNPETITNIVILGGANDSFWAMTDNYVQNNMNAFASYANEHFPYATLNIGFIARIRGTNPSGIVFKDLLTALYNYSSNVNFEYMHGLESSLYVADSLLQNDNMHPTTTGGALIAKNAAQFLKGAIPINTWNGIDLPSTVTVQNGTSTTGIHFAPVLFDGNMKHFDVDTFDWIPTGNSLDGEFSVKIGTHGIFYASKDICIPVNAVAIQTGIGIMNINANIKLSGYDVYLEGRFPESSTSWSTHTSIVGVNVYNFSFDIPAIYS